MADAKSDFELKVTSTEVEVLNSPAGSGLRTSFKLPFSPDSVRQQPLAGKWLFESLFADKDVRWLYERSRMMGDGLRLKLHLDEALACYPWERLYDPNDHSLTPKLSVLRYHSSPIPTTPLALSGSLRILIAVGYAPNAPLEEKIEQLVAALAELQKNGVLQIVVLKKASLAAIHQSLRRNRFHVLHYLGDCIVTKANQPSKLRFWNSTLESDSWVEPLRLWRMLSQTGTLRFIWLNSCRHLMDQTILSLEASRAATSLVEAGLPAIMVNRLHLNHQAIALLSSHFYKRLAYGESVDQALAIAARMISQSSQDNHDWTSPMLFTHTKDGLLFTNSKAAASTTLLEPAHFGVIPILPLTLSQSALYHQASRQDGSIFSGTEATILPFREQKNDSDYKKSDFSELWAKEELNFLRSLLNLIVLLLAIFLLLTNY